DEVEDRAQRPRPSPHGEAAHRGERPAALAVEVELLAHEDERRGDGDRDVTDLARDERKVAVSAVAAEDVESEHARQSVVEKDVHDHAEADGGVTHSPPFDGAGAKPPAHRPREIPPSPKTKLEALGADERHEPARD